MVLMSIETLLVSENMEAPKPPLPETEIPLQILETEQNTKATTGINTSINNTQIPVKQRKVSKIIVLFDDGSFQEM